MTVATRTTSATNTHLLLRVARLSISMNHPFLATKNQVRTFGKNTFAARTARFVECSVTSCGDRFTGWTCTYDQARIATECDARLSFNMADHYTARRKLAWVFVGVALANTPARKYTPLSQVSPAKSPTSHCRC